MAMPTYKVTNLAAGLTLFLSATVPAPAQEAPAPVVFRVEVVARSTKAINFHHRQGSTTVALEGSALASKAKGEVRVDSKTGATKIDATVEKLPAASSLAEGYLTYVMWAITPEGRAENLGEVMLDGDRARLQAATELQTFGIIVTAEPYYAVTQPSDTVVMEGVVKSGATTGTIMPIDARYELVARGGYLQQLPPGDRVTLRDAKNNIPLDLMEARQAMAVARAAGGERHAGDTLRKAAVDLGNAEAFLKSGQDRKKIQTLARHVTQLAEDARLIAVRKNIEEALAAERAAADQRANALTLTAEREAERRRQAEQEAELKNREAQQAQTQAEQERIRSAQLRERTAVELAAKERQLAEEAERSRRATAEAEQVRLKQQALEAEMARARAAAEAEKEQAAVRQRELEAQTNRAKEAALAAEQKQQQLEAEKARLRADLVRQLNLVLMTRETARGLIVNMSDVLFDTGRYALKPGAREKLAKIAGIVLAHPGLRLEVEGHTDSTGGLALNQRLSEQRATSVRDFLTAQGIDAQSITARGFGPERPVAENSTAAGRQANRRVELVVSGEAITPTAVSQR
jgi:outer membrane protein OmpA-like peptidoglycan-associated protein